MSQTCHKNKSLHLLSYIHFQLTEGEKSVVTVHRRHSHNNIIMSVRIETWGSCGQENTSKWFSKKQNPFICQRVCNSYLLLFAWDSLDLCEGVSGGSGVRVGFVDLPIISITVAVSTIASSASSGTRVSLLFCRFNISKEFKFSKAIIGNVLMLNKSNQLQLTCDRSSEIRRVLI